MCYIFEKQGLKDITLCFNWSPQSTGHHSQLVLQSTGLTVNCSSSQLVPAVN